MQRRAPTSYKFLRLNHPGLSNTTHQLLQTFRPKSVPASPSMPRTLLSSMRVQISSAWQGSSTTKTKVETTVTKALSSCCRWRTRRSGAATTAFHRRGAPKPSRQVEGFCLNFDLEWILILILIPDCRRFFLKLTASQVECVCRRSEGFTFLFNVKDSTWKSIWRASLSINPKDSTDKIS